MLNESASTLSDRRQRPAAPDPQTGQPYDERLESVQLAVMQVMLVDTVRKAEELPLEELLSSSVFVTPESELLLQFNGTLTSDSEAAFTLLDEAFRPLRLTPALREKDGKQQIYVIKGRAEPQPRSWVWNAVLFVITFFSVLYVGATLYIAEYIHDLPPLGALVFQTDFNNNPLKYIHHGLPYALAILLILGAHEMGHYFAARRRGVAVTLPYFLPLPFGLTGTLGAFIQLREPIRSRKILLEIGAAGPLAGLIFAIPILLIGLATSPTAPIGPGLLEGNSIFYALAKRLIFGDWVPNAEYDVLLNQLAWAGWTGLLITGLNLMPIGQLDGGHVIYSLIGRRARHIYLPVILILSALTVLTDGALLFMLVLLILFGRAHAVPLDDITPLPPRHRMLAIGTLAVFALVFVPVPLAIREVIPAALEPSALLAPVVLGMIWLNRRRESARA